MKSWLLHFGAVYFMIFKEAHQIQKFFYVWKKLKLDNWCISCYISYEKKYCLIFVFFPVFAHPDPVLSTWGHSYVVFFQSNIDY